VGEKTGGKKKKSILGPKRKGKKKRPRGPSEKKKKTSIMGGNIRPGVKKGKGTRGGGNVSGTKRTDQGEPKCSFTKN